MTKNKLYAIISIACFLGLAYLFCKINYSESSHLTVCIIKNVTGYACPSCGTTRAVQLFLQGEIAASVLMNPFGILVAILMIISPIWILFDVITKKETFYFYSEEEKQAAVAKLVSKPEITRFKGLGEISPDEFARFIGPEMKLQPVMMLPDTHIQQLLEYYMGKNTPSRQDFIIDNLKVELDLVEGN